jgi:hypothetical protein
VIVYKALGEAEMSAAHRAWRARVIAGVELARVALAEGADSAAVAEIAKRAAVDAASAVRRWEVARGMYTMQAPVDPAPAPGPQRRAHRVLVANGWEHAGTVKRVNAYTHHHRDGHEIAVDHDGTFAHYNPETDEVVAGRTRQLAEHLAEFHKED